MVSVLPKHQEKKMTTSGGGGNYDEQEALDRAGPPQMQKKEMTT